ncbi:MAG: metallophosphoesterase [Aristaeellaceae bacterium]
MILKGVARRNKAHNVRQINHVTVTSPRILHPLTLAVVADLHDGPFDDVLPALAACDAILIVGDLVDRHLDEYERGLQFLDAAADIAPTFCAIGNHERKHPSREAFWHRVEQSRATLLDDRFVPFGGMVLGGLSSRKDWQAERPFLREMAERSEFRLLMCHHPEYYGKLVKPLSIDLTVSGHAHGGQVRLGKLAAYAPGQGFLPRLTSGFYDNGRLLVSRGMTNATWMPRFRCPCEMIVLHLEGNHG